MFSPDELAYLRSQPLARLATLNPHAQPDVVPVAFEADETGFWVGGGATVVTTRKIRNIAAGRSKVALVVDDLISLDPFVARGIRVYGTAGAPQERTGLVGPGTYVRITATTSWSWNLHGQPAADEWYATSRTDHSGHRQL
ncbi:PPOX class F420-dependent oxidoreductase [Actinophytocola algeriensis]|uniref:Pyridoxamine 5'-phosphate oxidase family protein n=1 Tax=Actinophytocola algeriensis TaxID=1768010 RepID=A0A7W7Q3C1_9PSEU|nr:PPOX class F420-dependent oxidoreductase [Actinophytocola algeriensis]MBB4906302.1 pyridoxamine 5'-phosphate oxidase family protein [Actinophytocola algeriensis]MBE1477783.1 pyridoxamine 5'-phosphate oxidase family protein [Actinophytocola algeriensis]